jgi:FixJ family two-component response regulator
MSVPAHEEPVVFLIDPDPSVRRTVKGLLKSKWAALELFATADRFFAAYDPSHGGCLLVDIAVPEIDGVGALDQFARKGIDLAVIFLAAECDAATVVEAIKAGAFSFLEKPCTRPELWERTIDEAIAFNLASRRERARRAAIARRLSRLTGRESRVLGRLLDGKSNRQIAGELGISVRGVEDRRARIMKKMKAGSLAELVRLVLTAAATRTP